MVLEVQVPREVRERVIAHSEMAKSHPLMMRVIQTTIVTSIDAVL